MGVDGSYSVDPKGGEGVHVYVFDTGVRTTHEDFQGRAISALDMTVASYKECNGSVDCGVDNNGHGTHCAATVAGSKYGVAKSATVHSVKICPGKGCGPWSWSVMALNWIEANGQWPAVVSMSVGGSGYSPSLAAAIENAVDNHGITVVVAAGNRGVDACDYTPAGIPQAITVGMTSIGDAYRASNYGPCVDIFAPGVAVVSASHLDDVGSATKTGTSMATPHVAGAVALFKMHHSDVGNYLISRATNCSIKGDLRGSPNKLLFVGEDSNQSNQSNQSNSSDGTCNSDYGGDGNDDEDEEDEEGEGGNGDQEDQEDAESESANTDTDGEDEEKEDHEGFFP